MATQAATHLAGRIGGNIAAARKRKGMSQLQLAAALETSTSRVSGWETGEHVPGQRKHQSLADLLFDGDIAGLYAEPEVTA